MLSIKFHVPEPEPGTHISSNPSGGGAAMKTPFPTGPAQQVHSNGGAFPSSPSSSSLGKYDVLGRNYRRMKSTSSTGSGVSSDNSPSGTRSPSFSDASSDRGSPSRASINSVPDAIPDGSKHVTYKGEEYFTTRKPTFADGSYVLNKVGGTRADALFGKPSADGAWVANPVSNVGMQIVKLGGKEYLTSPLPEMEDDIHLLYPLSSRGFIKANDAVEARHLSSGEWQILNSNHHMPPSTPSPTPSAYSATPSTRPSTPSSQSFTSRSESPSPAPSTAASDANTGTSFFAKLWQRVKNIF